MSCVSHMITDLAGIVNQSELFSREGLITEVISGLSTDVVFMCYPGLVQSVQKCAIISLVKAAHINLSTREQKYRIMHHTKMVRMHMCKLPLQV